MADRSASTGLPAPQGVGLALVSVGLVCLDVALLSPLVGLTEAALPAPGLLGGAAALLGGGLLVASRPSLRARVLLAVPLVAAAGLFVMGIITHGQVGEFSDLAAVITFMIALAVYVVFLGGALWGLDGSSATSWVRALVLLAGLCVVVGVPSLRWTGPADVLAPVLVVGAPLVLMTLASGGLLLRWLSARDAPTSR